MNKTLFFLLGLCLLMGNKPEIPSMEISINPPNILWIYVEDLNPVLSCYGANNNPTPAIDFLAENGVLFENAYTPAPVCSAARSAIITSTMPTTFGTHNHHSSRTVEDAIFLPKNFLTIPEIFKTAGYYTFNHGKDDYNFIYNRKALYNDSVALDYWYTFSGKGNWIDSLSQERPFFGQVQLTGGKWGITQLYPKLKGQINPINRDDIEIPPYYPDIPEVREDIARHYDAARMTDLEVANIIQKLKDKNLLNNTYIFFFTDHGYKGIRHKQFVYDGGIQIPLIVSYFGKEDKLQKNKRRKDLVSGIDIGTTSLALAGLEIPKSMEGFDFFANDYQRDFIIATRDRCDFSIDRIRAVRTKEFKYIKNYMPERSYTQPSYRDQRTEFKSIKAAYDAGNLNEVQAKYWKPTKPKEELFDLINDPYEINNLAENAAYKNQLNTMRNHLQKWQDTYGDKGTEPQNPYSLLDMYKRWGERCVNPEFDTIKTMRIPNTPRRDLTKG
ncbi:sulfatase family protein [Leeuwenhoekiella parthenopeia]|uniref:sulfatase family protein n=1 Tax=Leeuwenhoekiella parthenopeia TaxID=2890320 RepID=UPI001D17FB4A|nr:sulfatase [Leeuwenhoekiella parthenopeia]